MSASEEVAGDVLPAEVRALFRDCAAAVRAVLASMRDADALAAEQGELHARWHALFDRLDALSAPLAVLATAAGPAPGVPPILDAAERLIVTGLATGMKLQGLAQVTGLSERTVIRRLTTLRRKIGAENMFQLGIAAAQHGWAHPAPPATVTTPEPTPCPI